MSDDPLIGQHLANFRLDRVIGRGGMGQIYAGEDIKLGRPVALKVIDSRHRGNPAYAQRFVREARSIAALRHDNIINIYYADDQDGLYYFAMEYLTGVDLGEIIAQHARESQLMPPAEVLRVGRTIASALDYAHSKAVIHRDVKPANVMLADDGRIVLMDFGLALDAQQGSVGEVFGSSHYIAPEQARRSSDAVAQSDLYSLGVMLYEMLTGVVPFDDPSPTSVALQHITTPPPPPRQINPDLSEAVEAVLIKALAKTPAERYQTGAQLIDALDQALSTSPPATLLSSESLVGHELGEYRIDALLGRGGMAHIYRGMDLRLKRYVAIKVIDTPFRQDSEYTRRFMREAQAIAQLEHPYIVRLYHYGDAQGLLYMVMEYIEGTDLDAQIMTRRINGETFAPGEITRIVSEVCMALDYAHSKGVIHRDIKPSNIMLDRQGRTVLTDFGLALLTDVGTRGEIFGSPHYVAPEQAISSASVVPQSDLYALGVILYEIFTGQLPFDAPNALDIAMRHMSEPPPPPSSIQPDLNPAVEAIILKLLAKDPQERYPTGAAVAQALEQALQIVPGAVIPGPAVTQAPLPVALPAGAQASRPSQPAGSSTTPPVSAAFPARPPAPQAIAQQDSAVAAPPALPPPPVVRNAAPALAASSAAPRPASGPYLPFSQPVTPASTAPKLPAPALLAGIGGAIALVALIFFLTTRSDNPASSASATATSGPTQAAGGGAAPNGADVTLQIVRDGDTSLAITNQSATGLPLAALKLGTSKNEFQGTAWGVATLDSKQCVMLSKEEIDDEGGCANLVGGLVQDKKDTFWKETFNIYYADALVGACPKASSTCIVTLKTQ